MDTAFHTLENLFDQLGLPSTRQAVIDFIARHAPLDSSIALADASFWNADQKEFLADEILRDADWAEVIDLLNVQLREFSPAVRAAK